ncbi:MAG: hypothetical protein QOI44_328 [Actinomycetota bacterium]|nr:hypothetical protein [Actinomycetota bacterium]
MLLPVPFGATTPIRLWGPIAMFTRSRTTCGPNDLEMSRATTPAREVDGKFDCEFDGDTTAPLWAPSWGTTGVERTGRLGMPGHYIGSQDSAMPHLDRLDFDDDGELIGARIVGARHAGEVFPRARLVDVELVRCDLAGCDFSEAVFHRTKFVDCRGVGIELGQATFRAVVFEDCRLDDANLRLTQLAGVRFESSVLARTDFGGARLEDVSFRDCDLTGADYSNARCSKVDLRGSRLVDVKGVGSLKGAIIGADQLPGLAPGMAHALGMEIRTDEDV